MEALRCLQAKIMAEFPQVDCQLESNHGVFLKATTKSSVTHGLRYLPNFHVIFTCLDKERFCSRLITYHGRSLDTFIFKRYDNKDTNLPKKVLAVLNTVTDGIKLCQGIEISKVSENCDCLIECFNDAIVARHKKCNFLLPSKSEVLECNKCQTLFFTKTEESYELVNKTGTIKTYPIEWSDETEQTKQEAEYLEQENNILIEPLIDFDINENDYDEPEFKSSAVNKKKRGRPLKIQSQFIPEIDPSTKRKRGRPRLVIPPNEIRPLPAQGFYIY